MNRKMPYDGTLILVVLALLGAGLVMVFSASSVISKEIYGSSSAIFYRQLTFVGAGLILMLIAMRIDHQRYANGFALALLATATIGLLAWALFGPEVSGVRRWVQIGPARFQPSEIAKLTVVLLTAYFLVRSGGRIERIRKPLLPYMGVVSVIVLLILLEPDFGTSTSIAVTAALLLFLGGLRSSYYFAALLPAVPAFFFLVYQVPYRRQRLLAFWDPEADPFGAGYQILQSLVAVGSGGVAGKGLAQGTQKLFFLPEPHTDFIFAVIGEENGLWGCALVLLLFLALFWRGLRISLRADNLFGTYVGLGIVTTIVFQALFNMSVVLSLSPTKGIPLPFVSVGGSSVMVMLVSVGILLNISRHSRIPIPGSALTASAKRSVAARLATDVR
jgi:cell division protein FtsW